MSILGELLRLEAAALACWPPAETRRLDGWLLRASGGHTRRANSVQALVFAADTDLGRAIDRVEAWYRQRGLPPCFQVTDRAAPAALDAALAARRYARISPVSVLTRGTDGLTQPVGARVELDTRPTPRVMNAVCDPLWGAEQRRGRAELFARIRRPHAFATALDGLHPVSGALCVVDRELAGLLSLRTAVAARGRGHARAVVGRLGAWARGMGAKTMFLQVEDDNAAMRGLLRALAVERRYGYWYRELEAQAA